MTKEQRYLNKRIKSLRKEQTFAFNEMQRENLLQLCYACGFGKGYIIGTDLLNQVVNSNDKIFGLLSHRLGLNEQHISDIFELLMGKKSPLMGKIAFAFVGSSGGLNQTDIEQNDDLINRRINDYNNSLLKNQKKINLKELILTTTSKDKLLDFISKHSDRKVIIVSTYHSCEKLSYIHNIGTIYADEAHTLASNFNDVNKRDDQGKDSHMKNYLKIVSKRKFFFTATPKDCSDDIGSLESYLMNNPKYFGRRIEMSHLESIDKGYILGSTLESVYPQQFDENFNQDFGSIENKAKFIMKIFEHHREWLRKKSAFPNKIAPKLLIRCSSVEKDLWPIVEELKLICGDIMIFASAAEDSNKETIDNNIIYQDNVSKQFCKKDNKFIDRCGYYIDRKDYIEAIQALSDTEEAIILHHDTISEGINVPGLTCFVPFSDKLVGFAKLYQNIGRVIRLNKTDKKLLEKGKIEVYGSGWIKPEAHIIIPYWSNISKGAEEIMIDTIMYLETKIGAKISDFNKVPNSSDVTTGFGSNAETTHRKREGSKRESVEEVNFKIHEKVRRRIINSGMGDLLNIEDVLDKFSW